MKVDNPMFDSSSHEMEVRCYECPFTDEDGFADPGSVLASLCMNWPKEHLHNCPTKETYEEACLLADMAYEKENK